MPTRIIESTRNFNAVAAGQTATLDLPTTRIYHGIRLVYTTTTGGGANQTNMEAHITEVRIKVNGKVQRRFSAAHAFAMNAYRGKAFETGILPIFFSEPHRRTVQGEDALAWGMADVDTFQVEVDIDAAALTPTIEAVAITAEGRANMGPIVKLRQFVIPVAAIGIVNVPTLPKNDAYYALHCLSAVINSARVLIDQKEIINATAALLTSLADDQSLTWQTGYFHLDFAATRRVADSLAMTVGNPAERVSDFQIDFDMSAATSFTMIAEVLGFRD